MNWKKNILLAGAVALLVFLLVRTFFLKSELLNDEKKWFVKNLNYQFSFLIDTISVYGYDGKGFLIGRISKGNFDAATEKELLKQLKEYKTLTFVRNRRGGTTLLTCRAAKRYQKDDSLYIDSDKDQIVQYREGKILAKEAITESLMVTLF